MNLNKYTLNIIMYKTNTQEIIDVNLENIQYLNKLAKLNMQFNNIPSLRRWLSKYFSNRYILKSVVFNMHLNHTSNVLLIFLISIFIYLMNIINLLTDKLV